MKNTYRAWVLQLVRHQERGAALALGGLPAPRHPKLKVRAPKVLIFSPHPDDECIVGGLALRLRREAGARVVNIAVTLGSNQERRASRARELEAACAYLGFEVEIAGGQGLENVTEAARHADPAEWACRVRVVAEILCRHAPRLILVPHAGDAHPAHRGTHCLVMDALAQVAGFAVRVVETEFWAPMAEPNLLVEISPRDVGDLVAALSCHVGEVQRNPYHLRLPAWMQDNVRRGSERMLGQGQPAPACPFAVMYRQHRWPSGGLHEESGLGRVVSASDDLGGLLDAG